MSQAKYAQYFLKEPWGIPHFGKDVEAPVYIGVGQEVPVKDWDEPFTQAAAYL